MVILIKFVHSCPFYFSDSQDVSVHSCHLLNDLMQFTLIHSPLLTDFEFDFLKADFPLTLITPPSLEIPKQNQTRENKPQNLNTSAELLNGISDTVKRRTRALIVNALNQLACLYGS